ncbi:MAG: alpha/beta fold hydrolase [Thiolinea sp.]
MPRCNGIEYREQGNIGAAEDIPIICLHGIGGNCDSFTPQLTALSAKHRVISWTMPGYGNSAALAQTDFDTLSQSLASFMQCLNISQAHLIGHSIGGMIAQELAITQPQYVKSLSLLATTSAFGGRDNSFKEKFLAARLKPLNEGKSMAELAAGFVPQLVAKTTDSSVIEAAITSMSNISETSYRTILECLVTFNRYHETAKLAQPSCLIAGREDKTAPPATMQKMADKIQTAEFHVLEDAGHLLNLEAAETCNQILLAFIQRQQ